MPGYSSRIEHRLVAQPAFPAVAVVCLASLLTARRIEYERASQLPLGGDDIGILSGRPRLLECKLE